MPGLLREATSQVEKSLFGERPVAWMHELYFASLADLQAATRLTVSTDPSTLAKADVIIIAVPTPVDDAHIPDFSPLEGSSTTVGKHMKRGAIVVYESTVYPGATEEVCIPVLERTSEMKWLQDFHVGPCRTLRGSGQSERPGGAAAKQFADGWHRVAPGERPGRADRRHPGKWHHGPFLAQPQDLHPYRFPLRDPRQAPPRALLSQLWRPNRLERRASRPLGYLRVPGRHPCLRGAPQPQQGRDPPDRDPFCREPERRRRRVGDAMERVVPGERLLLHQ